MALISQRTVTSLTRRRSISGMIFESYDKGAEAVYRHASDAAAAPARP